MAWRLTWEILLFYIVLALVMFGAAGTLDWWGGWAYLGQSLVGGFAICIWLLVHDPGLLQERLTGGLRKDQVFWDKVLMGILHLGFFAWLILMALDRRWSISHMPRAWNYAGLVLSSSFYVVCWLVFRENSFAAPVVRLQAERSQKAVTTGLYGFVRHPMYAGGLFYFVGLPLTFGSWLGLAVVPLFIAILVVRIPVEEKTLRGGLAGYDDYALRVRYRLVPGIW